jgi:SAM-dependent methyltransferase
MTFMHFFAPSARRSAALLLGLSIGAASLGAQAVAADSFPRPDRPVSRIVAPRWVAEDRRDAFGEADQVMKALRIGPGMRVADIGAGDGYYVQRLSERVGPTGLVFGEDIEPRYLALLRDRVEAAGWKNVRVIEGTAGDPAIPAGSIDVALMIHMYHEITEPFALLHRLAPAFRAGGRLAVLDLDGPTDQHGTPPRLLACELGALGYERVRREAMADGAYLIIFRAPDEATRTKNAAEVRARVAKAGCKA